MDLVRGLERFGDLGQYVIPSMVGGYALLSGRRVEALALGVLGYIQMLEVFAIKREFPRDRPEPFIAGRVSREDRESFPSSHTGGAFLGAGFACGLYGAASPITIATVAMACLVGASRYFSKKHWPTDIVVGALIGGVHGLAAANCGYFLKL